MLALITFKVFQGLLVVFPEFPHDILTNITVILFDLSCNLQLIFRRHIGHFTPFSHQIENKLRDIASSNGYVLDRTSDDVTFGAGNNVGDTVTRVDDCSSKITIRNSVGRPRRGQSKDCLDSNVQALDIERLEEDLRSLLPIFRRIERWFGLTPACDY
jgi:hypothetical protein